MTPRSSVFRRAEIESRHIRYHGAVLAELELKAATGVTKSSIIVQQVLEMEMRPLDGVQNHSQMPVCPVEPFGGS